MLRITQALKPTRAALFASATLLVLLPAVGWHSAPGRAPVSPVSDEDFYDGGQPGPAKVELGRQLFFDKILSGSRNISCASCHEGGEGKLDLTFTKLLPNGVYTLWHDFMVWPPTDPFIGTYDLPFGARDGSENVFTADANGNAEFAMNFAPCLQLSGEHLLSDLAIAWHSDGKTYGPLPGEFSTKTHVQMYVALPKRNGV